MKSDMRLIKERMFACFNSLAMKGLPFLGYPYTYSCDHKFLSSPCKKYNRLLITTVFFIEEMLDGCQLMDQFESE